MQQTHQGVVYGYSEVTIVSSAGAPPYPEPLPQPPPRRRMSPFRILVRAFIAVCFFIGALSLLIWLIYRPRTIQVAVITATLSRFDLNSTANAPPEGLYQDARFGRTALPVSFQGTRHTDTVPAVLAGSLPMSFGDSVVDAFRGDNSTGVFPVDLWINGVVRYKFGELTTTTESTLSVKCHLALQLMVALGWVECTVIDF
ncbi:NDR1/HIN1-like protein 10 [Phragmites australis]|uniref:NDR1/HIN1-like protein 10 n=1 Tax=Phragmites australis TaxID=29695 RepID=UPI002D7889FC|nr:NDR1/HIN1-like protein 10 [Phragmites australis]